MTYDAARDRIVLFGGIRTAAPGDKLSDTWEFDGTTWMLVASGAPQARNGHAMAYDSARLRTVMFSGLGAFGNRLSGTWEWDGTSWQLRTEGGPSARRSHAMAYDVDQSGVVLVGGYSDTVGYAADSWVWDGLKWNQIQTSGALAISGSVAAYDTHRSTLVLFGGFTPITLGNGYQPVGTRELVGSQWVQRLAHASPFAYLGNTLNMAMAFDTAREEMVLLGVPTVINGPTQYLRQTFRWSGASWEPIAVYDSPRGDTPLVFDSVRGRLVGLSYESAETWEWMGDDWLLRKVAPFTPAPSAFAIAFDGTRGETVVHGGSGSPSGTWLFGGAEWNAAMGGNGPYRVYGRMCFDAARESAVLFGGRDAAQALTTSTYTWDGSQWTLRAPAAAPSGRWNHVLVYDPARGLSVLIGGTTNGSTALADLWAWDGENWSMLALTGAPLLLKEHVAAFDETDDRIMVLYQQIPGTFGLIVTDAPKIVSAPQSVGVTIAESLVITTEVAGALPLAFQWYKDDQPLLDDGRMSGLDGPTLTISPATVADSGMYRLHISNACSSASTSQISVSVACDLVVVDEPDSIGVYRGEPAVFEAAVSTTGTPAFQWSREGKELSDGGSVSGATTPQLMISAVGTADAGAYRARIDDGCAISLTMEAMLSVVEPCQGDADRDGAIDFNDITAVLANWGTNYPPPIGTGPGDATLDGDVDFVDITSVLANWGKACE